MSDWAGGELDFIGGVPDWIGSDWSSGNIDWGALATNPNFDFDMVDTIGDATGGMGGSGFGMNDRGLGTAGGGTLSPEQIAGLGGGGMSLADILKGVGGSLGGIAQGVGRGLGITDQSGGMNWGNLLSLLAPIGAGVYEKNRVDKATDQQLEAINRASAGLTGVGTENKALYAPYRNAGEVGLGRLLARPPSNLAGEFRPLGSARGLSLSNVMRGR